MHALAVRIGNFFFRFRNTAFPVVVIALFALAAPPSEVFGSEALEHVKDIVALAIALLGLALRATVIGYAYIKRGGLKKRVYAKDLVTDGLFALSRNPLYLGNLLICVGMFLMHGNLVVMLVGVAFYTFVYQCVVLAEEAYLSEKFGEAYRAYCRDVPRWIPDLRRFHEGTEGMRFNFRRVLAKDYTTFATTIVVLALIEAYEYIADGKLYAERDYLIFLAAVVIACGVFVALVKATKKRLVET